MKMKKDEIFFVITLFTLIGVTISHGVHSPGTLSMWFVLPLLLSLGYGLFKLLKK